MTKEMIIKRLEIIADLKRDLNSLKENYDDALDNNPVYQEVQEEEQKLKSETRVKKEKVLETPTYKAMSDKLKDIRREIKEHGEVLSQDLVDYYKESGETEIEDNEGNKKRLKFSVTLVATE
ncbi:MAG: hypothetical protein WC243_03140 [Patescibacteria group bacterium]|jgi:hypothetical protein